MGQIAEANGVLRAPVHHRPLGRHGSWDLQRAAPRQHPNNAASAVSALRRARLDKRSLFMRGRTRLTLRSRPDCTPAVNSKVSPRANLHAARPLHQLFVLLFGLLTPKTLLQRGNGCSACTSSVNPRLFPWRDRQYLGRTRCLRPLSIPAVVDHSDIFTLVSPHSRSESTCEWTRMQHGQSNDSRQGFPRSVLSSLSCTPARERQLRCRKSCCLPCVPRRCMAPGGDRSVNSKENAVRTRCVSGADSDQATHQHNRAHDPLFRLGAGSETFSQEGAARRRRGDGRPPAVSAACGSSLHRLRTISRASPSPTFISRAHRGALQAPSCCYSPAILPFRCCDQ